MLRNLAQSRSGSIAPLFAVAVVPLALAAGASVDATRMVTERGSLQDMADSAALAGASNYNGLGNASAAYAVTAAENFITAAATRLGDHPTPSFTLSCSPPAKPAVGVLAVAICATPPSLATTYIGTVKVMIADNLKMTMASVITPSIDITAQATAQGAATWNMKFTFVQNFSSSAADLNQIYAYELPPTTTTTGTSLYTWTPATANMQLILSNAPSFKNPTVGTQITVQVPYSGGQGVAFALKNTTGGISGYGSNCYGQAQGAVKYYYTHTMDSTGTIQGAYYDTNAEAFHGCGYSTPSAGSATTTTTLSNCTQAQSQSTVTGGYWQLISTWPYLQYVPQTSTPSACQNNPSYVAGSYIYSIGYNRNPLRFGLYDTSGNYIGLGNPNRDCTTGLVTYDFDDNGGSSDDNDYNDAVFSADCESIGVQQSSVRLIG